MKGMIEMKLRVRSLCLLSLLSLGLSNAVVEGQNPAAHQHDKVVPDDHGGSLSDQIQALHAKVLELELLLRSQASGSASGMDMDSGMGGMGMMNMMKGKKMGMGGGMSGMGSGSSSSMDMDSGMGGMGMMNMMKGKGMGMGGSMSGMGGGSSSGMNMDSGMGMGGMGMMDMMKGKKMGMMGKMKGMGGEMVMTSALPGFPGASHLYHVGATDFYLDHGNHIALEGGQIARINAIKEKATLADATTDRSIEEAEQKLWELTAEAQPDAEKIESKIRQIEQLRGKQRISFIRAVGEAAKILKEEQIQMLTGSGVDSEESDSDTPEHKH